MGFQKNLYALRRERGMSQRELGEKIDVSAVTIGKWEKGETQPSLEHMLQLADLFHLSMDALAERASPTVPVLGEQDDLRHLQQYQKLDRHGKRVVDTVCAIELERIMSMEPKQSARKRWKQYIPLYTTPSAAGITMPLDENDFTMVIPSDEAPEAADCAVRISGDSMAPYIQDGDIVYVRYGNELRNGDVGIFSVNGAMYCKQYFVDEKRNLHLKSANPERRNMDVYVPADSDDTVEVVGKVLGVRVPV